MQKEDFMKYPGTMEKEKGGISLKEGIPVCFVAMAAMLAGVLRSEPKELERWWSRFRLPFSEYCIKNCAWAKLCYLFLWDFFLFFLPKYIRKEIWANIHAEVISTACTCLGPAQSSLKPPANLQVSNVPRLSLCFRQQVCFLWLKVQPL